MPLTPIASETYVDVSGYTGYYVRMSFSDFIKSAMSRAGVTNATLAKEFGVTSQAVSQWRNGATVPTGAKYDAIRNFLEARISEKEGIGSERPDIPPVTASDLPGYLPISTLQMHAGMGGGGIVDDAFLGPPKFFEAGFIYNELRAAPEDLCLVEVEGQSMEPLLRHGDTVLVDRRKVNLGMEGIFVLFDGDYVVCKWAERVHGSDPAMIRIRSSNSDFSQYEVEASRCQILGRVVWFARRL